jgi:hypothetical protein
MNISTHTQAEMAARFGRTWDTLFSHYPKEEFDWRGASYIKDLANDVLWELEANVWVVSVEYSADALLWTIQECLR